MTLKEWARTLMRDVVALWLAARDPRTQLLPKVLAGCVAAYALSPFDLIPDFIPVLGYLDDLLIVPAGIWLVVRMIPGELMAQFRVAALASRPPAGRTAAITILLIWTSAAAAAAWRICSKSTAIP